MLRLVELAKAISGFLLLTLNAHACVRSKFTVLTAGPKRARFWMWSHCISDRMPPDVDLLAHPLQKTPGINMARACLSTLGTNLGRATPSQVLQTTQATGELLRRNQTSSGLGGGDCAIWGEVAFLRDPMH